MRNKLSITILSFALLSACGGDGKGNGPGGDGTHPPGGTGVSGDFARYLTAICAKWASCPAGQALFGDATACARFEDQLSCGQSTPQRIDGLDSCIAAVNAISCTDLSSFSFPAACDTVAAQLQVDEGTTVVDAGGKCDDQHLCKDGLTCGSSGACGTCEPLPSVGESCATTYECVEGASCNFDDQKCVAEGKLGDACESDEQCPEICLAGKCAGLADALMRDCSSAQDCGGLPCIDGKCAPRGRVGAACLGDEVDAGDDLQTGYCVYGSTCVDGKCTLLPECGQGQAGEACFTDVNCKEPLVCGIKDGKCAQPSDGVCDPQVFSSQLSECERGQYCLADAAGETGTCTKRHEDGASCTDEVECVSLECGADGKCGGPSACELPDGAAVGAAAGALTGPRKTRPVHMRRTPVAAWALTLGPAAQLKRGTSSAAR
jgi:hypothetical protein